VGASITFEIPQDGAVILGEWLERFHKISSELLRDQLVGRKATISSHWRRSSMGGGFSRSRPRALQLNHRTELWSWERGGGEASLGQSTWRLRDEQSSDFATLPCELKTRAADRTTEWAKSRLKRRVNFANPGTAMGTQVRCSTVLKVASSAVRQADWLRNDHSPSCREWVNEMIWW